MEKLQLSQNKERKRRTFRQYSRLYKDELVSREEFLQCKEDCELAEKQYSLICERLLQDSIYRSIQMQQMEENLENMQRNLSLIRARKSKLDVRAGIDGSGVGREHICRA